ncbi:MAG: DUF4838 domain-containing protein [Planctomycetes bacterium]|nr:DUF4838 domain-containing protein [Planctomycetota bacterium]
MRSIALPLVVACCSALVIPLPAPAQPPRTVLAIDGKAIVPIIVATNADPRTRGAARTLADYLGKIADAKFEVRTGDGAAGIAVGMARDFPTIPAPKDLLGKDPTRAEDYWLHSHAKGVYILGATGQAVEHGVWDLLHRLGYRQFFPGPTWEVIPTDRNLSVSVDRHEHPSYHARRIWYGYGAGAWAKEPYADWCAKNRATSGITINSGHAYQGIAARNKAEFDKHPEYRGLVNGERKSHQFCISNEDLRKLVVRDALQQFAEKPDRHSISVEPADGGGWCECKECKKMGSVSDRVVTLANQVAEAVQAKHPDKYVGIYAYSSHSPPPSIKVHPRVVVQVATAFIQGGFSVDQLMTGWQKQNATIGIREYYSVNVWDRDLPGKPRGSNIDYLARTISRFHSQGARFMSAESSDNWGCNGLGYYLAARMLWDVNEAKSIDPLKQDFLDKAFGPAQKPMADFYRLIDAKNKPLLTDDLLGRMYRKLDEARGSTKDARIHARLDDLVLYTRYVELWSDYSSVQGEERQKRFETMIKHALRMRTTMMIHTHGLVRDLPNRDKTVTMPKEAKAAKEGKNPWLNNTPFASAEIAAMVKAGIASRSLFDFEPRAFSDDLVPTKPLKLANVKTGSAGLYSRGVRSFHTWIDQTPAELKLNATGGVVYQNKGDAVFNLFPAEEVEGKSVSEAKIAPDKMDHAITLKTTFKGLHRIEVSDHSAGTRTSWPDGLAMTLVSRPEAPVNFAGRWSLYFYVPKGTKVIGGYASGVGDLLDGAGKKVHTFDKKPAYFSVPVPAGQDGKLWKFQNSTGQRLLMTVPPCLARNERELLLPREVVERDGRKD